MMYSSAVFLNPLYPQAPPAHEATPGIKFPSSFRFLGIVLPRTVMALWAGQNRSSVDFERFPRPFTGKSNPNGVSPEPIGACDTLGTFGQLHPIKDLNSEQP